MRGTNNRQQRVCPPGHPGELEQYQAAFASRRDSASTTTTTGANAIIAIPAPTASAVAAAATTTTASTTINTATMVYGYYALRAFMLLPLVIPMYTPTSPLLLLLHYYFHPHHYYHYYYYYYHGGPSLFRTYGTHGKTIYSPVVTNNIWSYLLWSPVIVYHH